MEFVFVVPRGDLFPDCYPHGIIATSGASESSSEASEFSGNFEDVVRKRGFFVERAYAERNPDWKQVIPYTIVMRGDEVFLLRRLSGGGDKRLHDKLSIGVGGHINPEDLISEDADGSREDLSQYRADPVAAGTKRELAEELEIEGDYSLRAVGILNDETNPVGAVHVGWLQVLELEQRGSARIREHDVLEGEFVSREHLSALLSEGANFETWSRLIVERLDDIIPHQFHAVT